MFKPFFIAAMIAPGRQLGFRKLVVAHVLVVAALCYAASVAETASALTNVGYGLLVLGFVEGAALVGWRLTQLPKSQALEFLLTSPLEPRGVFVAEASVGVARFALVWLSGVPVIAGLAFCGIVDPKDLLPLAAMPFVWGLVGGFGITAWVYESRTLRRIGELFGLLGVFAYLVVGVLAGENLRLWLEQLPEWLGQLLFDGVFFFHNLNPFGVVRYWFASDKADWLARERFEYLHLFAAALLSILSVRAAYRLKGHFQDRHYSPISSSRPSQLDRIGDRPLSWWAVRRVMEYSGRINLWLAGGFALIYAAFIVAGENWPAWLGKLVFQLFETWGGAPMIATALAVMAAVPAVFQYGLWDSNSQDRCRRLELLLLTELTGRDYWNASLAAAWKRGRGYLFASAVLWLALAISGRNPWFDVLAAAAGGFSLWGLAFAVGFRAFASGHQSSGIASLFTLGLPLALIAAVRLKLNLVADLIPTGLSYTPLSTGVSWTWGLGFALAFGASAILTRYGLARCDRDLRKWLDANQGKK